MSFLSLTGLTDIFQITLPEYTVGLCSVIVQHAIPVAPSPFFGGFINYIANNPASPAQQTDRRQEHAED
jgi:hypothetical protein